LRGLALWVCVWTLKWEELGCGFVCWHYILRGFGLWVCCVLALNFERTWIVGLCVNHYILRVLALWVCVWTLKWEELGCGFVCWHYILRAFGWWVCCVLDTSLCVNTKFWEDLGCGFVVCWTLNFERIWRGFGWQRVWPH